MLNSLLRRSIGHPRALRVIPHHLASPSVTPRSRSLFNRNHHIWSTFALSSSPPSSILSLSFSSQATPANDATHSDVRTNNNNNNNHHNHNTNNNDDSFLKSFFKPNTKTDYEQIPENSTRPRHLLGSVVKYDIHMLVALDIPFEQWPSKVEKTPQMKDLFKHVLRHNSSEGWEERPVIKLSAIDVTADSSHFIRNQIDIADGDIMVFPNNSIIRRPDDAKALVNYISSSSSSSSSSSASSSSSFTEVPLSNATMLVCAHGSRDARCGDCGPRIMAETHVFCRTTEGLSDDSIKIWPVSHIGGHAFAGNLILYPSGDWYGHLRQPSEVRQVLKSHFTPGQHPAVFRSSWRGRMGLSMEECTQTIQENLPLPL